MPVVGPGVEQVIRADKPSWIPVFTGLSEQQFRTLVSLVAVYYRTNLTLRQVAPLFGVSKSAAGRIVEHLAGYLVLAQIEGRHPSDTVLIVDGTLVPTHDRSVSARSKNYRYSANLQVV